jgi:transcriptional regulator with XRE-family HTH domain
MMNIDISKRIRQRREELHMTQTDLGKKVEKSTQVISNWERGYTPTINYDDIVKLAEVLSVTVDWLLGTKSLALDENDADTYDERIANLSKENQQVIERILCSLETEERVKEEKEGTSQGR